MKQRRTAGPIGETSLPDNSHWEDRLLEWTILLGVCVWVLGLGYLFERRYAYGFSIRANSTELRTALFTGLSLFVLSNLSFLNSNTPFSAQTDRDIFYIRTLVDLLGVVSLFALHIQRIENDARYTLSVTNALLESQYQQFRISQESIDLINRKASDYRPASGA